MQEVYAPAVIFDTNQPKHQNRWVTKTALKPKASVSCHCYFPGDSQGRWLRPQAAEKTAISIEREPSGGL